MDEQIIPAGPLQPPFRVNSPNPPKGAVDVTQTPILSWLPGYQAASHQIYFGTDENAVLNAAAGSPEDKGTKDLGSESYEPGLLEWDTTYYWRVDEVNDTNPDSPWTGAVWSFTTANFLVIDDMESYNDLLPDDYPDTANRIYDSWWDGWKDPANGSQVGHLDPPFAEQTIVHSGLQSMPFAYNNAVGKSETTFTLTDKRDWTVKGVDTLSIWYIGDPANDAETMYVVLNGTAGVDNPDANAAQVDDWTEWTVSLQEFNVDLTNVNSITIGFGNRANPVAGGSGSMYFDDIALH